jgi:hypothetical protein
LKLDHIKKAAHKKYINSPTIRPKSSTNTHKNHPNFCISGGSPFLSEFSTVSYRIVPYRTIPYQTVPYRTKPYRTVAYRTVPYHTVPYHTVPYRPYRTVQYRTVRIVPYRDRPSIVLNNNAPFERN